MKEFLKKNFNFYHWIGMALFVFLSVLYWHKTGQFSDNVLKNNLLLMIIWGLLVGYITADLVGNAIKRKDNQE
ncbi:MAG: hypothetical protein J5644_07340 [Bacteroidales bacterium]|nr:hypothetical protein [Bacteroidales bacterium]